MFAQMDGMHKSVEDRVLVVGSTNLPQELDEVIFSSCYTNTFILVATLKQVENVLSLIHI